MKLARFYCDSLCKGLVKLDTNEAHHLVNVLRLETGQAVRLFDGAGKTATAVVTKTGRKEVFLEVNDIQIHSPPSSGRVVIATSIPKGNRFDEIVTKCTELGVAHIAAVVFGRTVKQPAGAGFAARSAKLATAAARQCENNFLPMVSGPCELDETIKQLSGLYPAAQLLFGGMDKDAVTIRECMKQSRDTIAFVGPEGGMSEDEECILRAAGALKVRLTETILRVETAAIAFAAVLCLKR